MSLLCSVEDMDLSLRAYLRGWKFVFLNDVEVRPLPSSFAGPLLCRAQLLQEQKLTLHMAPQPTMSLTCCLPCVQCVNEIPSTYAAFRHQQHRWSCGPMQLWRSAMMQVWESDVSALPGPWPCSPFEQETLSRTVSGAPQNGRLTDHPCPVALQIPFLMKAYLNIFFFGTRLFATHIVSFVFYCTLVPICVIAPEVRSSAREKPRVHRACPTLALCPVQSCVVCF